MYQQESGVMLTSIANVCNRIVRRGGKIVTILPDFCNGETMYVIIYTIQLLLIQ